MVSTDGVDIPVPRNPEAEQALLGAVIQSAQALADAARLASVDDFWSPAHILIWKAAQGLADSGQTVDPLAVMDVLRRAGELERAGGANYLHELIANPWTGTNVGFQARLVHECARARRALQIHQRIGQLLIERADDHDRLLSGLASQALDLELLVDERTGTDPIVGLSRYDDFIDRPRAAGSASWLIPGLLRRQDVLFLLAGEGGGKTWLDRQLCFCAAAGTHPFKPSEFITPRVVLFIDLENPEDLVAEESHRMRSAVRAQGAWKPDNLHLWHRPGGLNLRERADAMLLERAVAETGAEIVGLGSLYKSFKRRGDSWDQAAEETQAVFDRIRERYGVAFILEHHMPKGDGGASFDRPQTAYGSQQWVGWASMGRIINRVGDWMYRLDAFRGDRGEREWPLGLVRGGDLPWGPVWDKEELEHGMWEEARKTRRR